MGDSTTEETERRPTDRVLRSRRVRGTAGRLDATLARLGLMANRGERESPLVPTALRALGLAMPDSLSERERRLIELAGQASELARQPSMGLAFHDHSLLYLALACCSWARRDTLRVEARTVALAAATALAALASENLRELMGVSVELRSLARLPELDAAARDAANLVGVEEEPPSAALEPVVREVVERAEPRILAG